jgi:2-C-methyl-D-erythritol 2,4-cyclodiphosphate synthase
MKIKVGFGYDVHQLAEGESLVLGGIPIHYHRGCVAHSDGDVLIHAICDALLGAANLRDIGYHFPDTSKKFEKIDSKILLKQTVDLLTEKGYSISNIDSTIAMQKPKLKDLIPQMIETLALVIGLDKDDISIKATTTEKLGHVGREEGVDAYAVVLITRQ